MVSIEEKKAEAKSRLITLKVLPNVIREFDEENKVNASEDGILYWLTDEEKKIVKDFENEHNAVVYHCIRNNTEFGKLLALLYVSDSSEEWQYDNDDLSSGYAFAYVHNFDEPLFSEFGSIGIAPRFGGILRTA